MEALSMANKGLEGNVVMSVRKASEITDYQRLHLQSIRNLYITVEVLDKNDEIVDTIQGLSTGGSININGESLIRRTGNLTLVLLDEFVPKVGSTLWMTNKIRVYAGLEDILSSDGTITHFCLGTFYISEPAISINTETNSIDIILEDNMARWETMELENRLVLEADTPLSTAVTMLMNSYGEWNVYVDFSDLKIPYKMEFSEGDNVLNILAGLRDLYMDWECYYDVNGSFIFRKMNIQREDGEPIVWTFDEEADLITSYSSQFSYKEVKNRVLVIGQMNEKTGITPKAEANIILESSPFHKNEIGQKSKVIVDTTYSTAMQCDSRARYELFKSSSFQEKINIDTIPIYYLDANNIIEIRNPSTQVIERFVVEDISIGLTVDDVMSISGYKVYYDHFEVGSSIDGYREGAEKVINGITNLGWLTLSEERIRDYLGLEGSGSKLIVRFEYEGKYGVTAYVTGYLGDSTQSLSIDLADFMPSNGDSGDNLQTKSEYSDRILGHEMVHAVMNDALTVKKTILMPEWFKEGMAEFIHGADERLKTFVVDAGSINQTILKSVTDRSIELLNGSRWTSESKDYSAGYIIVKYIDTRISPNKSWRDFMNTVRLSSGTGYEAIKEAIVENTDFESFYQFATNFTEHVYSYARFNIKLDVGKDEIDTGSIAGTDHRGTVPLSAEDIFDNSKAVKDKPSHGFNVTFIRP